MLRLISFILLHQIVLSQVFWSASCESGYYNSSGDFLQSQEEILTRLNIQGGYNYQTEKDKGNIKFQLRPEIYGFKNQLQTTKMGLDGLYSKSNKSFDWLLHLAVHQYIFTGEIADFSYDLFYFAGQLVLPFETKISLDIKTGYAYRNFNLRQTASLDIIFTQIDLLYSLNPFTNISGGIYAEKFYLKKTMNVFFDSKNNRNNGTRIGPAVKFNYTRKFVFNLDYQFLLHDSQITSYPSYDQWIRIIGGINIKKNVAVFILIDYYKKNFEYENNEIAEEMLYSPVNAENRIYLKFSNSISKNKKVFFKIGYYDEQLFYRNYSLTGWKGYIGLEIKG